MANEHDAIRKIIREEFAGEAFGKAVRSVFREELEPVKTDIAGVKEDLAGVKEDIAGVKDVLIGVIDERFPPVDQQRKPGGPPGYGRMTAKGS